MSKKTATKKSESKSESSYKKALRFNSLAIEFVTIARVGGDAAAATFLKTGVEIEDQAAVLKRALKMNRDGIQGIVEKIAEDMFPGGLRGRTEMPRTLKVSKSKGRARPHVSLPVPDGFDIKPGDYVEVVVSQKGFGVRKFETEK